VFTPFLLLHLTNPEFDLSVKFVAENKQTGMFTHLLVEFPVVSLHHVVGPLLPVQTEVPSEKTASDAT
jgi:hypothetical protein